VERHGRQGSTLEGRVVGSGPPRRTAKTKRIGDRETALRVAQGIRERLARTDLQLTPSETTPTLRTYVNNWLKTAKVTLKASTVDFYNGHLALHILPALGSRQVGSLRRADCRELVTTCRAKGLKATTVRGIARTLSTILTQAVEDELLPANPALRLGRYLRSADDPEPVIDPFTRDEAAHIVSVARQIPRMVPVAAMRPADRHARGRATGVAVG
jgi:hypothetical protein